MKYSTTVAAAAIVLALGSRVEAQNLSLTVTPAGGFTFQPPGADPDTAPEVQSPVLTLAWAVRGGGQDPPWTIVMRASSDLTSGVDTVPVTYIRWTGTGGLASGTALSTSDQQLIQSTGKGTFTGTITFYLQNLWTYKAGSYTTTIIFTISSP